MRDEMPGARAESRRFVACVGIADVQSLWLRRMVEIAVPYWVDVGFVIEFGMGIDVDAELSRAVRFAMAAAGRAKWRLLRSCCSVRNCEFAGCAARHRGSVYRRSSGPSEESSIWRSRIVETWRQPVQQIGHSTRAAFSDWNISPSPTTVSNVRLRFVAGLHGWFRVASRIRSG